MGESADLAAQTVRLLDKAIERLGGAERPEQRTMAVAVANALSAQENLVVQAGTGVGKSLAYLVPLLLYSARGSAANIVSTASLALQRQIITKDAPLVQELVQEETGQEVPVALLKGWGNYLCRYRLEGGLETEELLWEDPAEGKISGRQVEQLQEWAEVTETGDRDDFPDSVRPAAWAKVSVSKRECLGRACPFIDDCFPARAQERAFDAGVVVTNHALLGVYANGLLDVLPEFDAIVVDEGHDLAARVRGQGTAQLSAGLVGRAARATRKRSPSAAAALEEARDQIEGALLAAPAGLMRHRPLPVQQAMEQLAASTREARKELKAGGASATEAEQTQLARAALDDVQAVIEAWDANPQRTITWVEDTAQGNPQLNLAPMDVAGLLTRNVFQGHPVIISSATLAVGGNFNQIALETGIADADTDCEYVDVGTSFDPRKQGILYVAAHLPPPGREGVSGDLYPELVELTEAAGGGVLGLFSSMSGAQQAAEVLRERTDFRVLVQGEDNLPSLVQQFRADEDACLLGTISLWQGVDVPGRACRLVVIDRIPFPRPTDPVVQARQEDAGRNGRNGFVESSLAPATLLMAQGAGRLLRSASDRGMVAVLDSRLATKSYGNYVRRSIPAFWYTEDPRVARDALGRLRDQTGPAGGGAPQ